MTTRRQFIKLVTVSTGALVLGVHCSFADDEIDTFTPNTWLRIEPDGSIIVQIGKCELGQGVRTALPMIVAEELDADFADIRIEQASPGPDFRELGTGGSRSMMRSWDALRNAGAAARTMLIGAAATRWGVAPDSCTTSKSAVMHKGSSRTLAYRTLVADASKQAVPAEPKLKSPADFTLLGTSQMRFDGHDIVMGKATYGFDVRVPGMLHAVVARPPVLGGKAESFDAVDALKVKGVKNVVQIRRGIAIVAENTWAAIKGREALKVKWTDGPNAEYSAGKQMAELDKLAASPGITIRKDGEGRAAFTRAAKTVSGTFHYPWVAHASMEPVNCTVFLKDGKCEIWTPTQNPNGVQSVATQVLGLPESAVKVNVVLAGGGFGRRLNIDFDFEAIEIAKAMEGTPVHTYWTREDDMRYGHFQAPSVHHLAAGLGDDGKIIAWEHRKVSIPHNARGGAPSEKEMNDPATVIGWAWGVYDTPYWFPAAEMTYKGVDAPTPIGPWRSVFSPSSVFARECFLDEVAVTIGRDPVELRLELLGAGNPDVPTRFEIDGDVVERERLVRVIELVKNKAGWGVKAAGGRAWGFAASVFHTGTYVAHAVEVSLKEKPRPGELPFHVHRVVCGVDCGVVVNLDGVRQQVESGILWGLSNMKNEITFENGRAVQGNYDDFPVSMIGDTPPVIETHIVKGNAERPNGLGEPVVDTIPPAVANAVSRLAGRRIRSLPVKPADLA